MKRKLCIIFSLALICASLISGCKPNTAVLPEGESSLSVKVNGEALTVEPILSEEGVLMVPAEAFGGLGYRIWPETVEEIENDFNCVRISDVGRLVDVNTDSNAALLNSYGDDGRLIVDYVDAPVPAKIENGQVYVPAEFVCRGMGFDFSWDEASKTTDIYCPTAEAPLDRAGWNKLCDIIIYNCDLGYAFDGGTPMADLVSGYLFYPGLRDYFFEGKGQEVVYAEDRPDPRDRFRNYGDYYYYAVIDAEAVDTVLREVFGANDGDIEELHANDGDFYFQDGKYYAFNGDIGGPYCDVWKCEVTGQNGDGSTNIRMWINELDQYIGYCDCSVIPNGDGAEYPFRLLSVGDFVRTAEYPPEQ